MNYHKIVVDRTIERLRKEAGRLTKQAMQKDATSEQVVRASQATDSYQIALDVFAEVLQEARKDVVRLQEEEQGDA